MLRPDAILFESGREAVSRGMERDAVRNELLEQARARQELMPTVAVQHCLDELVAGTRIQF
jgi:hypothetical protein